MPPGPLKLLEILGLKAERQDIAKSEPLTESKLKGDPSPLEPVKRRGKPKKPETKELVAVHNLSAANLMHAHVQGGLAAPSLAITHRDHPLTGFGEISLVAHHDLVDPAKEPVFGADIYSPRHPDTRHEVVGPQLRKFKEWILPHAQRLDSYLGDLDDKLARGLDEAMSSRDLRKAMALAWAKERGEPIDPPVRERPRKYPFTTSPHLAEYAKEHGFELPQEGDGRHRALSQAMRRAIDGWDAEKDVKDVFREVLFDKDDPAGLVNRKAGMFHYGADAILDDLKSAGKPEADRQKFNEMAEDKAKGPEFEAWARGKLQPLLGRQYIPKMTYSGNWRRIPYTLENALKEMTRKVRQGEGFNYGLGTARAAGAKKFRDLEQMRAHQHKIVPGSEFETKKKAMDARFSELADKLRPYHADPGGFHVLDSLAESIGESYKRGRALYRELEAGQFKGVPYNLQKEVAAFAQDLLDMPTEYFEAKPQRIVRLREFKGAAVPHDAPLEVLEALKRHGVEHVEPYQRGDDAARARAIRAIADRQALYLAEIPMAKAEPQELAQAIVPHLTDDLRRAPWKGHKDCLAGHCYVAAESLYYLLGGKASGWVPHNVQHEGASHWYLKHGLTGEVLDPTASQFSTPVPYAQGRGRGFLTGRPSKRAQAVIEAYHRPAPGQNAKNEPGPERWLGLLPLSKMAVSHLDTKPIARYHDSGAHAMVDHRPDLEAHPKEHEASVSLFRKQVLEAPGRSKRGKTGTKGGSNSTGKAVYDVKDPLTGEAHRFMLKPYHEKVVPKVKRWMQHPIQGWAEMTNQALYHAGGIGHLHQKVHVAEVPIAGSPKSVAREWAPEERQRLIDEEAQYWGSRFKPARLEAMAAKRWKQIAPSAVQEGSQSAEPVLAIHMQPDSRPFGQIYSSGGIPWEPEIRAQAKQIAILDALSNNLDRHRDNVLLVNEPHQLMAIDNSRSFQYRNSGKELAPKGPLDDSLANYVNGYSPLRQIDPRPQRRTGFGGGFDQKAADKEYWDAVDKYNEEWNEAFGWWDKHKDAVKKAFEERLPQIQDPEVRDHLQRNFEARWDQMNQYAEFGVENFGHEPREWMSSSFPVYRFGTKDHEG